MASPKRMRITVVFSDGTCFYKYREGDTFDVQGLATPPGFCGAAYHTLFPVLFCLNFGGRYPFMADPHSIDTTTCPDGGKCRFRTERIDEASDATAEGAR